MRYMGGKFRIAKQLAAVLESYRKPGQLYIEPFVGGANVITKMKGNRVAYDAHKPLIHLYNAVLNGWIPPDAVSESEYQAAKLLPDTDPLKAFCGFGVSFAGKYFGGYAGKVVPKYRQNNPKSAKNALLRDKELLKGVPFEVADYRDLIHADALIYCDPPYANTTGYKVGKFDSAEFWQWCRSMSEYNTVLISEYTAPDDFEIVWSKDTTTGIKGKDGRRIERTEKLFQWYGSTLM